MRVIFQDREFIPEYSQVGLCDAEDLDSYPQWENHDTEKAIGPKGVAVGAWWGSGDTYVVVTVWEGPGNPGTRCLCTTTIIGVADWLQRCVDTLAVRASARVHLRGCDRAD